MEEGGTGRNDACRVPSDTVWPSSVDCPPPVRSLWLAARLSSLVVRPRFRIGFPNTMGRPWCLASAGKSGFETTGNLHGYRLACAQHVQCLNRSPSRHGCKTEKGASPARVEKRDTLTRCKWSSSFLGRGALTSVLDG
jgi:hypothetical protein